MTITAPLIDEEALSAAAWRIAWCEPWSGVVRAQLTKAQAASLYADLTGLPVQICGIPQQNGNVVVLLWLPAYDRNLMIEVTIRVLRYTGSVQKILARQCEEYPGTIWLTGRALLWWLSKQPHCTTTPNNLQTEGTR